MDRALEPGDELRCPHCRRWHSVYQPHLAGTEAALKMLYFDCRQLQYFAGFVGLPSRHPTRARGDVLRQATNSDARTAVAGTRSTNPT